VQLIHDTTQVEIAADPDRLLQVLTNLLSNAVKFSPPNSTISVMLRPGSAASRSPSSTRAAAFPPTSWRPSSAASSRWTPPTPGKRAAAAWAWPSAAPSSAALRPHLGGAQSGARLHLPRLPALPAVPRGGAGFAQQPVFDQEPARAPFCWPTPTQATRPADCRPVDPPRLPRGGDGTVEQTLAAAQKGVEAILLDTSLDGMNGWEILPLLRRLDPDRARPHRSAQRGKPQDPASELPNRRSGRLGGQAAEEDALLGELARVLCGPGENARILVVEDDVDLARVIGDVFARDTIEVKLAHTLQAALDACFSFQPHLLVLDIGLPDGDGFNVVDWLRQHENLARLPLVVYSGRDSPRPNAASLPSAHALPDQGPRPAAAA
jgi:CheY-like chemotaxis protein